MSNRVKWIQTASNRSGIIVVTTALLDPTALYNHTIGSWLTQVTAIAIAQKEHRHWL